MWQYHFWTLWLLSPAFHLLDSHSTEGSDSPSLGFYRTPPQQVDFSNSTGVSIDCLAYGSPSPQVWWLLADSSRALDVPRLRRTLSNGTLVFYPFRADEYRQDVHAATYKCLATNSAGNIISPDLRVRAVVMQTYEVQVYDDFVISGNTALLRCHVPTFISEYVTVTSWIRENPFHGKDTVTNGEKYTVLPTGELHVHDVREKDSLSNYRCQTTHRLTGETRISTTAGRLMVTEARGSVPPRITDSKPAIHTRQGSSIILPCAAQGHPCPVYRWYEKGASGKIVPLVVVGRIRQENGNLIIDNAQTQDSGSYVCAVNNSVGTEKVEILLTVTETLSSFIRPRSQIADIGRLALFSCVTSGFPVHNVVWMKDGKHLREDRFRFPSRDVISIDVVKKEDRGIYQCFSSNEWETVQATAELRLGDSLPTMMDTFDKMTLQPGLTASLKCLVSGIPHPEVNWDVDGVSLASESRIRNGAYVDHRGNVVSTLNITSVKSEDGGEYRCTAKNRVGYATHSAVINVYGPPKIRPLPPQVVVAGSNLSLRCPVSGYPIEQITWQQEGETIPLHRRQIVFSNGTLHIRAVQRIPDAGKYTCIAKSKDGRSVQSDFHLRVQVPPKIMPFVFPDLHEGMRAQTFCAITDGDQPITIQWLKDGLPLAPFLHVAVVNLDMYSSSLSIGRVSSQHTGNYTCVARNDAANVSHTAQLSVHVPPRWQIEPPREASVTVGKPVLIDCQAIGFPLPAVSWMKAVESMPGEYKELHNGAVNIAQFENGSLLFRSVAETDEGKYLCQATNGIGDGLSTVIFLDVQVPAHFDIKMLNLTAKRGEICKMQCKIFGDKPIDVTWRMNGKKFPLGAESRIHMKEFEAKFGMIAELSIYQIERGDSGHYSCLAKNRYGSDELKIWLAVQERPEPPMGLKILDQSSRSAHITWLKPYDGNSAIYRYTVQYKRITSGWHDAYNMTISGAGNSADLQNLQPATSYHARIFGENGVGRSDASEPVVVTTAEEAPSGSPQDLEVTVMDSKTIKVSWKPPKKDTWNGVIRGYHVGYRIYDSTEPYVFKTIENVASAGNVVSLELDVLRKFTKYGVIVQAFNHVGSGPKSEEVVAVTAEDVPTQPPSSLKCSALSSQSVHISWESPSVIFRNGVILGYKVSYKPTDEWYDPNAPESKTTAATKTILHGLRKNTNYTVVVLSSTRAGDGVKSDPVFCKTHEDVPDAPADIKVLVAAPDLLLIAWKNPTRPNGNVAKFTVYMRTSDRGNEETIKHAVAGDVFHFEAIGIRKNVRYDIWVTAATTVGEGQSTRVVSQTIASQSVPARVVSFDAEIVTRFKTTVQLPCQVVGIPSPDRSWKYESRPLDQTDRIQISDDGSVKIVNAYDGDAGTYSCLVSNRFGSDEVKFTLVVLVPPSPPAIDVTNSTDSKIQLHWKSGSQGSDTIRGYIIYYKRDYGEWEEIGVKADYDTYTLENLDCGTRYQVYITAFNAIGWGNASVVLLTKTKGSAPVSPPIFKLVRANSTFVTLRLEAWSDGGCPILHFVVEYKPAIDDKWRLVANNVHPKQAPFVIPDLTSATHYNLRVTAHNSAGSTMMEYDFATHTIAGDVLNTGPKSDGDSEKSAVFIDMALLGLIGATVGIVLVVIFLVCLYTKRRRKEDRKKSGPTCSPSARPADDLKASAVAPKAMTAPKNLNMGSFTCLLMNPDRSAKQLQRNPSPIESNFGGDVTVDDVSPYATTQIPGCRGEEMRTFSQRIHAPDLPPRNAMELTYSRSRKQNLNLCQRPDSLPLDCRQEETQCEGYYSSDSNKVHLKNQDVIETLPPLYAKRPSAPFYCEHHVPDLLDHRPDSSSCESSPNSRRRTFPHYGTTGNRIEQNHPSAVDELRHAINTNESSVFSSCRCDECTPMSMHDTPCNDWELLSKYSSDSDVKEVQRRKSDFEVCSSRGHVERPDLKSCTSCAPAHVKEFKIPV